VAVLAPAQPLPADAEDALTYLSELTVITRYPIRADLRSPGRADSAQRALDSAMDWAEVAYGWAVPRRPSEPATEDRSTSD